MWKNTVELDRPQMTNWCTRIACWVTKDTYVYTRWKHVILIAFQLQQLLHEHASVLRYTYIACLVSLKIVVDSDAVPRNLNCFSSHVVSFLLLYTVLTNMTQNLLSFAITACHVWYLYYMYFLLRIMAYRNARNYVICTFGLLVTVVKVPVVWGRSEITEWRMEGCRLKDCFVLQNVGWSRSWREILKKVWCGFDLASSIICGNKMPTRCNRLIFIADLIACSTCFGHHYAHHQELGCVSGLRAARKPDTQPSAPHYTDNLKTKHQIRQTATTCIILSSSWWWA
jgi:hypothetical protein